MKDTIGGRNQLLPAPAAGVAVACLFVFVLAVRILYVNRYGVAMPFWDQWDAEGDRLLKPLLEGTLRWTDLFSAHNEHRILPTRIVTLLCYSVAGEWNNLVEARASAFVYAFVPALLLWIGLRRDVGRGFWLLYVPAIVCLAILPFAWENVLVGFQSQFYFLIVFAILATHIAATHHENALWVGVVVVLAGLSTLTMASGLVTALSVAGTYLLACLLRPGRRWPAITGACFLLVLAFLAYKTLPQIPAHGTLRAQSLSDFGDALNHVLGWPVIGYHWAAPLLWTPGLLAAGWWLYKRSASAVDVAMLGLYGWSLAQAAAIAYGRGHGLLELTPRYSELLVPGLVANAWCCLRVANQAGRDWRKAVPVATCVLAFAATFFIGHALRIEKDLTELRGRSVALHIQETNAQRYLASGDPKALDVPFFQLPYPSKSRLKWLLDVATLRGILPALEARHGESPGMHKDGTQ